MKQKYKKQIKFITIFVGTIGLFFGGFFSIYSLIKLDWILLFLSVSVMVIGAIFLSYIVGD